MQMYTYIDGASATKAKALRMADGVTLYYSYDTIIAVENKGVLMVSENEWKVTTGKHLNAIDGGTPEAKKRRVKHSEVLSYARSLGYDVR